MYTLPGTMASSERRRLEDGLDCVIRAVFRAQLPVTDVMPLSQACVAALEDGVLTTREVTEISAAATALCRRVGGAEAP